MIKISRYRRELEVEVSLPSSKSISNRLLIIRSLCDQHFEITNISSADDTVLMESLLKKIEDCKYTGSYEHLVIDAKNAGTVFRFLTAYLAITTGEYILTGDDRMKQRPVGPLVVALQKLGANIEYIEKEGYPPLKIVGKKLVGGTIGIESGVSSQFISALAMIAPALRNGMQIRLKGRIASQPYVEMTLKLMRELGVDYEWTNDLISITPQKYSPKNITIESDWSSASYWYLIAAFAEEVKLELHGLISNSLQGDFVLAHIFENFGVKTIFTENGIILQKHKKPVEYFEFDFSSHPDLAQTIAVCCAGLNIPAKLTGLQSLKIKETDRLEALEKELSKVGCDVAINDNELILYPKQLNKGLQSFIGNSHNQLNKGLQPLVGKTYKDTLLIKTYNDHRMAMAFAPLAMLFPEIIIEDPEVVKKSYPSFWDDLKKAGFEITPHAERQRR